MKFLKSRAIILFIFLAVVWSVLLIRAFYLQVFPNSKLEELKAKQFQQQITLRSNRGIIFDRYGKELAISIISYSLFADPKLISKPKWIAKRLANCLRNANLSSKDIYEKIHDPQKRFVWLDRRLNKSKRDEILSLNIKGLSFIEESKRIYPNGSLLAQVLGFVGNQDQGLEGLELKYQDILKGKEKNLIVQRDARGRPLLIDGRLFTSQSDGSDLYLTIDSELQFIAEQELKTAIKDFGADDASAVILDSQTSEILAIANVPSFDLNHPFQSSDFLWRNRSVTDAFEPGSTMKTFTIASALKNRFIQPNTSFWCEKGRYKVGDRFIVESDSSHKFEWLTASEILAYSSNIGAAKIAKQVTDNNLYKTLFEFGFGQKTGVDLPGESVGIVHDLPWNDHLLSNISFGHGITASPLQIVNAYAAIANGGLLKQPFIVKKIHNLENEEIKLISPRTLRRVLSTKDAETLTLMLMGTTEEGKTGFKARIPNFLVSGKTGTAQKVATNRRGYIPNAYISSFAGFVPAHQGHFVIYVSVNNPRNAYYGSSVAAPVFARIAAFALRKNAITPTLVKKTTEQLKTQSQIQLQNINKLTNTNISSTDGSPGVNGLNESNGLNGKVPNWRGLSLRQALIQARKNKLKIEIIGTKGSWVKDIHPAPGEDLPKGKSSIRVYVGSLKDQS